LFVSRFFFYWWNCCDFANVDPNPRAWTSSYVEWKELTSSKRRFQRKVIKIVGNPWSMHYLVENNGI
jgi:hypothetical protein